MTFCCAPPGHCSCTYPPPWQTCHYPPSPTAHLPPSSLKKHGDKTVEQWRQVETDRIRQGQGLGMGLSGLTISTIRLQCCALLSSTWHVCALPRCTAMPPSCLPGVYLASPGQVIPPMVLIHLTRGYVLPRHTKSCLHAFLSPAFCMRHCPCMCACFFTVTGVDRQSVYFTQKTPLMIIKYRRWHGGGGFAGDIAT